MSSQTQKKQENEELNERETGAAPKRDHIAGYPKFYSLVIFTLEDYGNQLVLLLES